MDEPSQLGDGLQGDDFIRQIGPYDHYVINWGYRVLPDPTPEAERATLNRWIIEKADDPMYRFLPQGTAPDVSVVYDQDLGTWRRASVGSAKRGRLRCPR